MTDLTSDLETWTHELATTPSDVPTSPPPTAAELQAELDQLRARDTDAGVWRRLVADYRQALADQDELPARATALEVLAARNRVDAARLALFAPLDHTGKEAT